VSRLKPCRGSAHGRPRRSPPRTRTRRPKDR
jgi:hypothetical protein